MRLGCTGSRHHGHRTRVWEALDAIHEATPVEILIHGDCPSEPGKPESFDQICRDWAIARGIFQDPYPARWDDLDAVPCRIGVTKRGKPYNKLAGFNRNITMLTVAVPHVVAVGWVRGPGTEHMYAQTLRRGIAVMEIDR